MPPNKGMKLTNLSAAPGERKAPPRAPAANNGRAHRFAAYPQCSTDTRARSRTPP
jgi:hypothetical protein